MKHQIWHLSPHIFMELGTITHSLQWLDKYFKYFSIQHLECSFEPLLGWVGSKEVAIYHQLQQIRIVVNLVQMFCHLLAV